MRLRESLFSDADAFPLSEDRERVVVGRHRPRIRCQDSCRKGDGEVVFVHISAKRPVRNFRRKEASNGGPDLGPRLHRPACA